MDVEHGFAEQYEAISSRKKVIKELKEAAKDATGIYVATDPDREGEAIGWHLAHELGGGKRKIHRLMFNEITRKLAMPSRSRHSLNTPCCSASSSHRRNKAENALKPLSTWLLMAGDCPVSSTSALNKKQPPSKTPAPR